jgi:hypothetical protein
VLSLIKNDDNHGGYTVMQESLQKDFNLNSSSNNPRDNKLRKSKPTMLTVNMSTKSISTSHKQHIHKAYAALNSR